MAKKIARLEEGNEENRDTRTPTAFPRRLVNSFKTAHTDQPTYDRDGFMEQLKKIRDQVDVFGDETKDESAALVHHHEVRYPNDGSYEFCVDQSLIQLLSPRGASTLEKKRRDAWSCYL